MIPINQCSPERSVNSSWTCFTHEELVAMANAYNTSFTNVQPIIIPNNTVEDVDQYLHGELKKRFASVCGENEACWLNNDTLVASLKRNLDPVMYKTLVNFAVKPQGPVGRNEWLATVHIDSVLNQYERYFTNFKYFGCFPSNHFALHPKHFQELLTWIPNKEFVGIVFNQDEEGQRGSHWVACMIHNDGVNVAPTVEHFDPTGDKPIKNIRLFIDSLHPRHILISRFEHQFGDNECGMYSLWYILQRLKGLNMDQINKKRMSDSDMNLFRTFAFRIAF